MKKIFLILILSLLTSEASAKILKSKSEISNCQINFDKITDKDKMDCLQTLMQINTVRQGQRIADLELQVESMYKGQ